ncbi:MAG: tRNA (adenosine(37)-N6)-threonylcarbamoyltransferase complex transferase subunit TsaD, partial [Microgenomates group bacterium]
VIEKIGKYKILAETQDDALGEALDKGARLLGFGYPGASILEKIAKGGNIKAYTLPIPLIGDKVKDRFSYSGLKTAFVRLFNSIKEPGRVEISNLAASFQNVAFEHVIKVLNYQIKEARESEIKASDLLFGGGVANNIEIRKKLRKLCKEYDLKFAMPYSKRLLSDNAAMIGVCAYLKNKDSDLSKYMSIEGIDRNPRASLKSL